MNDEILNKFILELDFIIIIHLQNLKIKNSGPKKAGETPRAIGNQGQNKRRPAKKVKNKAAEAGRAKGGREERAAQAELGPDYPKERVDPRHNRTSNPHGRIHSNPSLETVLYRPSRKRADPVAEQAEQEYQEEHPPLSGR